VNGFVAATAIGAQGKAMLQTVLVVAVADAVSMPRTFEAKRMSVAGKGLPRDVPESDAWRRLALECCVADVVGRQVRMPSHYPRDRRRPTS